MHRSRAKNDQGMVAAATTAMWLLIAHIITSGSMAGSLKDYAYRCLQAQLNLNLKPGM